jgi:hypothetical protein
MSRYVFANAWELARHRLALLEQTADPATHAWLHRLGTTAGRDYWDVGAGGGSIVRWLSQQAGSSLCKIWHLYSGGAYGTVKAVRTTGLPHQTP